MHKFRRQAKFAAWYYDPEDSSSVKNPFRKYRKTSRANTLDQAENGEVIGRVRTDGDYRSPSNAATNSEFEVAPSPRHAGTFPFSASPSSHGKQHFEDHNIAKPINPDIEQAPADNEMQFENNEKSKDSTSSDTVVPNGNRDAPPVDDSSSNVHQRKGLKKLFHRKTQEEKDADDKNGKDKQKFTAMGQFRATILNSWINVLLIFSPIGIATYYAHVNPIAVFVINFIAIIPLAAMLSYATEEIALRTGETIGGLLNASFGNAVELIVSIIALTQDQVLIVQTSLIGSMLSNLLLVMGMCFFFGGFNRVEQAFNITVAQTASSLLFLAVGSLIIPTAFHSWSDAGDVGIAELSRGTAVLLLFVYGCYLFFQLKSHISMYNAPSDKNEKRDIGNPAVRLKEKFTRRGSRSPEVIPTNDEPEQTGGNEEEENEQPQLSIWTAIATLGASTVLVALNAEYLVDSINAITCTGGISKTFVGLILLPIVGNAAEHATAVTVAVKDKMDLAIGVAVGSSMQIALLVLPFVVVLGWIMGKNDMTLYFDGFQIAVLFVAVLLVNYLIQDGKSHWLEGVLLMTLYLIISVAAWFYPSKPGQSDCPNE